ncbi:MAG: class I adenylate-forming enzyme family protein [Pseudomonadota bacterium]
MPIYGPPIGDLKPTDMAGLLNNGLAAHPDEIALASTKNSWTWRQLDHASNRYAAHLVSRGVRKGDRVASLMPNRDVLVVHYLACLKAGFVCVPLNYRYTALEIDYALSLTGAHILLAHVDRADDLATSNYVDELPLGVVRYGAGEGDDSFEAMLEKEAPPVEMPSPSPGDLAIIFFTSGSTGKPKGVMHSFETLGWITAIWAHTYGLEDSDVMLGASSMSHIGAFGNTLGALSVGAKALVARTFDPDEVLSLFRSYGPSWLNMLPAALFGVVRNRHAHPDDFKTLRYCTAAGDKIVDELKSKFAEMTGVPIAEGYGMSELGFVSMASLSGSKKTGSVGRTVIGSILSIRSDAGDEVSTGTEGRLWVKSPSATIGYWDNPNATAETIVDGWLDTGDLMKVDVDGDLWFCGRKKQIIVHDGSNISPQEVEESLIAHSAVTSAGAVGVHDLVHGENVWAYVELTDDGEQPDGQELIAFSRARIGYKAPEVIVFVDQMPMNATGKVDRATLKHWAAERHDVEISH